MDGSDNADRAVQLLINLSEKFEPTEVCLLHVLRPPVFAGDDVPRREAADWNSAERERMFFGRGKRWLLTRASLIPARFGGVMFRRKSRYMPRKGIAASSSRAREGSGNNRPDIQTHSAPGGCADCASGNAREVSGDFGGQMRRLT